MTDVWVLVELNAVEAQGQAPRPASQAHSSAGDVGLHAATDGVPFQVIRGDEGPAAVLAVQELGEILEAVSGGRRRYCVLPAHEAALQLGIPMNDIAEWLQTHGTTGTEWEKANSEAEAMLQVQLPGESVPAEVYYRALQRMTLLILARTGPAPSGGRRDTEFVFNTLKGRHLTVPLGAKSTARVSPDGGGRHVWEVASQHPPHLQPRNIRRVQLPHRKEAHGLVVDMSLFGRNTADREEGDWDKDASWLVETAVGCSGVLYLLLPADTVLRYRMEVRAATRRFMLAGELSTQETVELERRLVFWDVSRNKAPETLKKRIVADKDQVPRIWLIRVDGSLWEAVQPWLSGLPHNEIALVSMEGENTPTNGYVGLWSLIEHHALALTPPHEQWEELPGQESDVSEGAQSQSGGSSSSGRVRTGRRESTDGVAGTPGLNTHEPRASRTPDAQSSANERPLAQTPPGASPSVTQSSVRLATPAPTPTDRATNSHSSVRVATPAPTPQWRQRQRHEAESQAQVSHLSHPVPPGFEALPSSHATPPSHTPYTPQHMHPAYVQGQWAQPQWGGEQQVAQFMQDQQRQLQMQHQMQQQQVHQQVQQQLLAMSNEVQTQLQMHASLAEQQMQQVLAAIQQGRELAMPTPQQSQQPTQQSVEVNTVQRSTGHATQPVANPSPMEAASQHHGGQPEGEPRLAAIVTTLCDQAPTHMVLVGTRDEVHSALDAVAAYSPIRNMIDGDRQIHVQVRTEVEHRRGSGTIQWPLRQGSGSSIWTNTPVPVEATVWTVELRNGQCSLGKSSNGREVHYSNQTDPPARGNVQDLSGVAHPSKSYEHSFLNQQNGVAARHAAMERTRLEQSQAEQQTTEVPRETQPTAVPQPESWRPAQPTAKEQMGTALSNLKEREVLRKLCLGPHASPNFPAITAAEFTGSPRAVAKRLHRFTVKYASVETTASWALALKQEVPMQQYVMEGLVSEVPALEMAWAQLPETRRVTVLSSAMDMAKWIAARACAPGPTMRELQLEERTRIWKTDETLVELAAELIATNYAIRLWNGASMIGDDAQAIIALFMSCLTDVQKRKLETDLRDGQHGVADPVPLDHEQQTQLAYLTQVASFAHEVSKIRHADAGKRGTLASLATERAGAAPAQVTAPTGPTGPRDRDSNSGRPRWQKRTGTRQSGAGSPMAPRFSAKPGTFTGVCFNCGQHGHRAFECTAPKKESVFAVYALAAVVNDGAPHEEVVDAMNEMGLTEGDFGDSEMEVVPGLMAHINSLATWDEAELPLA